MSPLAVGLVAIGILFILLLSRMQIGLVLGLVGFAGFVYLQGFEPGFGILGMVPYRTFADYGLSVVPLFILMGSFCFYSGVSKDLYGTVHSWLGQLRGGLAMATVGACAAFAAVSGSSLATAATMGTVALPEMKRYRYDDRLATGSVAAGGTIGILIPPSTILIIYGIITEQSIAKLFAAGLIPGVLEAVFYMLTIFVLCRFNPLLGPPGPKSSLRAKIVSFKGTWSVLLLFTLVMGGLYLGVFSPTEAAGMGAFGAFVIALARRRLGWHPFKESLFETGKTTAMIFIIIMGAMIFNYFLAVSRLPFDLAEFISGLKMSRYIIFAFILITYLFLGCIMSALAMVLLTVPIFYPMILTLGFDPIWFGIIIVRVVEVASITPPVGLNVFVIQGVAKDVPMYTIFRGILPFFIADLLHIAFLIFFPQVCLFLPSLMK